ncbi:hypothetical protein V6N13_065628 [Hibiscus sabdariffa]
MARGVASLLSLVAHWIGILGLSLTEKVGNNEKKQGEGDARVVGMEEEDKRMVRPDEGGKGDGGGGRWNGCS